MITEQRRRWIGRWGGRRGGLYVAEIWQAGYEGDAEEVSLAWDEPGLLEWPDVDKLTAVQGSRLTLRLISETDRQYYDTYTTEPGTVRLVLYRDGSLYWTGTLDTEVYEEPYATESGYVVELTFSDLAILGRRKWASAGLRSIASILDTCVDGLDIDVPLEIHCSTTPGLDQCFLATENFYDEDGEAMTLKEVVETALVPYGLRMQQKGGRLLVTDLQYVLTTVAAEPVWWASDDQVLGVDRVYNRVVVRLSQYATAEVCRARLEHDKVLKGVDADHLVYLNLSAYDGPAAAHDSGVAEGFRYALGDDPTVVGVSLTHGAKFIRIDSVYSGTDLAAIAYKVQPRETMHVGAMSAFYQVRIDGGYVSRRATDINGHDKHWLRARLSLMYDVRYNPFENAELKNEEGNYADVTERLYFLKLRTRLRVLDEEGNALCHYSNDNEQVWNNWGGPYTSGAYGGIWVMGDDAGAGHFTLSFVSKDADMSKDPGKDLHGWMDNSPQLVHRFASDSSVVYLKEKDMPTVLTKFGNARVPLPPCAGRLEWQISGCPEVYCKNDNPGVFWPIRWVLLKDMAITVADRNGKDIDTADIEDSAWLDRNAEEELEIDTKAGTPPSGKGLPTALGAIRTREGAMMATFTRAGVTDRLERLLIGTVYSQYAERKAKLTGLAGLLPAMTPITDGATAGKFIITQETQHLGDETSEITAVELGAEDYQGIDYEAV